MIQRHFRVGRRAHLGHWVLIVIGLAVFAYPLTLGATMPISCRGMAMVPGDTCAKAGGQGVQSYDQRFNDRQNAVPVIMVTGALVVAFGAGLLISGRRQERSAE